MTDSNPSPLGDRLRRRAEYGALRAFHLLLRVLPLPMAYGVVEGGMVLFYRFSRYRQRALDSLEIAFGDEMPPEAREELLWQSVRYQAWFFVDVLLAPIHLGKPARVQALDFTAFERLRERHEQSFPGMGALLVGGHLGTIEVASLASARAFWPHTALARRLDNPWIWQWVLKQREGFRRPTLDRSGVLRKALRLLKSGGSIAMLNDQNAGPEGEFVPFFGRLASTHVGAAALAVHTGAPIYVMGFPRPYPRRFGAVTEVTGPFTADPEAEKAAEIHRLTAVLTAELEALTRRHPEQAMWAHRRWKTRPPEENPS